MVSFKLLVTCGACINYYFYRISLTTGQEAVSEHLEISTTTNWSSHSGVSVTRQAHPGVAMYAHTQLRRWLLHPEQLVRKLALRVRRTAPRERVLASDAYLYESWLVELERDAWLERWSRRVDCQRHDRPVLIGYRIAVVSA